MTFPAWIAAIVCFLQLPIPLYWFVLHPAKNFWSTRRNTAYIVALLASWVPVTAALFIYHRALFRSEWPAWWAFAIGLALIVLEVWIFGRVRRDLGGARLVGATELSGGGEIARSGIYARIRHPRYAGSFLAIVGACIIAATRGLWIVAAIWVLLTGWAIAMEERELRARFGASYREYCRHVPRFVPRFSLLRNS
jgi:protein-S-isoprenylcysteine O-methyltransferase Ste14